MQIIHTATARGRTAMGATADEALEQLARLVPVHRLVVSHDTMFFGKPDLEVIRVR